MTISQRLPTPGHLPEDLNGTRIAHPTKYVAAQLKECGKLKECTTGIKECKHLLGVSLTQLEHCHNIMVEDDSTVKEVFYSQESAKVVMARFIVVEIHQGASNHHGASFAQNYILQKGLKLFGEAGSKAAGNKELDQLHSRNCFSPRDISTSAGNSGYIPAPPGTRGNDYRN
jgi:hypothetical protein